MAFTLGIVAIVNLALGYILALVLEPLRQTDRPATSEDPNLERLQAAVDAITQPERAATQSPVAVAEGVALDQEPVVDASPAASNPRPLAAKPSTSTPADDAASYAATLAELHRDVATHRELVTAVSEELIEQSAMPEPQAVESCRDELLSANRKLLANEKTTSERLLARESNEQVMSAMRQQLSTAFARQTGKIYESTERLATLKSLADPVASCAKLLDETNTLAKVDDELGTVINAAKQEIAEQSQPADEQAAPEQPQPEIVRIVDSSELETRLNDWWEAYPGCERALNVIQVEIERYRQLATELGSEGASALTRFVQEQILRQCGPTDVVSGLGSSRFLMLMPDADGAATSCRAEELRAAVCAAEFRHNNRVHPITIRVAVTDRQSTDTVEDMLARAASSLNEARRAGRVQKTPAQSEQAVALAGG